MKVAYIANWLNRKPHDATDSAGIFIKEHIRAMQDMGIEAVLLFPDLMPARDAPFFPKKSLDTEGGIPVLRRRQFCPPKWSPLLLRFWISQAVKMYDDYVQQFGKPDLVHAHNYWSGFVAQAIYLQYGIPFILTEHDIVFLEKGKLRTWLPPFIESLLADAFQTATVSQGLKNGLAPYSCKPIDVIANVIDTPFFTLKPIAQTRDKPCRFISIGTLTGFKQYDLLIPAFANFVQSNPVIQASLSIIGSGSDYSLLQNLIAKHGMTQQIKLVGQLSKADVLQVLHQADIFVSSSRVETFGVAMAEAMSVGLPILATPTAGAQEILTAKTGITISDYSHEAMVTGLYKMYSTYQDFNPVEIRQHVVIHYSAEKVATAYLKIYKKAHLHQ